MGFLHLICALFAAVGLALLVVGLRDIWQSVRTRGWPTALGTIVSAEELRHRRRIFAGSGDDSRIHYDARIHYEYSVGRVHIGSTVVRVGPTETSDEAGV